MKIAAPLALILAFGGVAAAQEVPLEVEAGYRFVDVTGNKDMYRTQINDREGLFLRSLSYSGTGFGTSFIDSFRVDASDLGVGPAGAFRLTLGKAQAYRLDVTYRRTEHFSAEPGFANPLLSQGVIPGQHTMDRKRQMFGVELEILPGGSITPIVGYSRNHYEGPGTTTYTLGGDEFRLSQTLYDTDQEVHAGVGFHFGGIVSGKVIQGWRKYISNENVSLVSGAGAGNSPGTVLGQPVTASSIIQYGRTDVNTPVTTAVVAITPIAKLKLLGSYVRANAESADFQEESSRGSFVSFDILRFFTGLDQTTNANAQTKNWRGSGRAELNIIDGLDFTAEYFERHRELSGYALISNLYIDATTFAGLDKKNITDLIEANTSLERTDKVLEGTLSYKALGPVALRVGYATDKQDITVTEDPSEIVVPGAQGGSFTRNVSRLDGGVSFRMAGAFLDADYQRQQADVAVVRTDFISRDRYRVKAGYAYGKLFTLALSGEQVDTKNDWPGIDRDGRMKQYGADLTVTPWKTLFLRGSAHRFQGDNTITYRVPQNFNLDTSVYTEDGKSFELGAGFALGPIKIDGSFARLDNYGDNPFRADRTRLASDFTLSKQLGFVFEWDHDEYTESHDHWGDFDANRYGLYLRFNP